MTIARTALDTVGHTPVVQLRRLAGDAAAAIRLARKLGPGHAVVTVAVDTGLKYLAGDLFEA